MLDMLKLPSDIILLDMLDMSDIILLDMMDMSDIILLEDMLKGTSVMLGLMSGGYPWSEPRGPFIGSGCSMPGMMPGWGGMKPMGPGGKKSGEWPANLPP